MTEAPERRPRVEISTFAGQAILVGLLVAAAVILVVFTLRGMAAHNVLGGIFTGLFAGFVVVIAGASLLAWAITPPSPPLPPPDTDSDLARRLAPTLQALERVRATVRSRIRFRTFLFMPVGAALGAGGYVLLYRLQHGEIAPIDLALMAGYGGFFGLLAARLPLAGAYGRLYKSEVLPKLAADFGDLRWRRPDSGELERFRRLRLFRGLRNVRFDDELYGVYRGQKISLRHLRLQGRQGADRDSVYSGLLVEVALASDRPGETLVIDDAGPFGNLIDAAAAGHLQRVGLEDQVFERAYQVYGSDQVISRAVLSPDVMERLLALREGPTAPRPVLHVQDSDLFLLTPRVGRYRLFDPPGYLQPSASTSILSGLYLDISAALKVVDSVIELDAATARAAGKGTA